MAFNWPGIFYVMSGLGNLRELLQAMMYSSKTFLLIYNSRVFRIKVLFVIAYQERNFSSFLPTTQQTENFSVNFY